MTGFRQRISISMPTVLIQCGDLDIIRTPFPYIAPRPDGDVFAAGEPLFDFQVYCNPTAPKWQQLVLRIFAPTDPLSFAECDHSKQVQLFRDPGKFQHAFFCQLSHIGAVGGHTADPLFGECTGLSRGLLAGITQRTAAVMPLCRAGRPARMPFWWHSASKPQRIRPQMF